MLVIDRSGYKFRPDWREATNLLDKQKAIENGLLAVFVAKEDDEEIFVENFDEELFEDEFDDEQPTIVVLDFLFDETPLTGVHHFRQPSAKDVGDYERTMKKATNRIMRWAMLLSCGIVIPFAAGIRHYFKQKMLSDKLEAELWLANRQKVK